MNERSSKTPAGEEDFFTLDDLPDDVLWGNPGPGLALLLVQAES